MLHFGTMSWKWMIVVSLCFVLAAGVVYVGYAFKFTGYVENLLAEAVGVSIGLGLVIWLIEGPILTRERKVRAILEYRKRVFQVIGENSNLTILNLAQALAFEEEVLHGLRGWGEVKPAIRRIFRRAASVRGYGFPSTNDIDLDEDLAHFVKNRFLQMLERIKEVTDEEPKFVELGVLGRIPLMLRQIRQAIERIERLDLLSDVTSRYEEVANLGEYLLDILDEIDLITLRPVSNELW